MDFLELLVDKFPDAGPNIRQSIWEAQQKLEMLQEKNPQEAAVLSRQLGNSISQGADPRFVLESIGMSYKIQLGKQSPAPTEGGMGAEDTKANAAAAIARAKEAGVTVSPEAQARVADFIETGNVTGLNAELAGIDSATKTAATEQAKTPTKSSGDISFEQNASAALRYANELTDAIKKYGTYETYDSAGSAKLAQLPYQMAIAYSKVVDPTSVAREGEVAAAQKYLIPTGMFTRDSTALSAANEFKKDIVERINQYNSSTGTNISTGESEAKDKNRDKDIDEATQGLRNLPQ